MKISNIYTLNKVIGFFLSFIVLFSPFSHSQKLKTITDQKFVLAKPNFPITYIRCPRSEEPIKIFGNILLNGKVQYQEKILKNPDVYDVLPGVSNFFSDFTAPCDLILRNTDGSETVLYDCSSKSNNNYACAAMDPAVSFDGKNIAFTVFHGKLISNLKRKFRAKNLNKNATHPEEFLSWTKLPTTLIKTTSAQLHFIEVETGKITPLPYVKGEYDSGPAWLSNGRIAFTSTRSKTFMTALYGFTPAAPGPIVSQIHTMDIDGRNIELASYHTLAGDQHPLQLKDGRLAYSSWQIFGALPYRSTNGNPGGPGTLSNFFHLYTQNPDGSNTFALYGQHLLFGTKLWPTHQAAHFLTQSTDERIWVSDYYRGNNRGLGIIVGFPLPKEGQEGNGPGRHFEIGDLYRPLGFSVLASWASNEDVFASEMKHPPYLHPNYKDPIHFAGKLGHPSATPNNGLIVTWGKGGCSNRLNSGEEPMSAMASLNIDNPGCDTGIYFYPKLYKRKSHHPLDMAMIVDSRSWHEFMARALVPYSKIHNQKKPSYIPEPQHRSEPHRDLPLGSPFGILSASSIIYRETFPVKGISFEGEKQWGLQGTDTIDYSDSELCGIRILGVQPNRTIEHQKLHTYTGERVFILGEFPVRNYKPSGQPSLDKQGNHDTSFRVRIPANMPYLMQAIDCAGRTLNSDQTWQHLRPMEQKTCGGCHVHGKEGLDFNTTFASSNSYKVKKLGEGFVPIISENQKGLPVTSNLNVNALQIEFDNDIMPIFERHCSQCHGEKKPARGLQLTKYRTDKKSTWYCLTADKHQKCIPKKFRHKGSHPSGILRRPQLSKYIRFMNARGSLLYWKAINRRMDNRYDNQYNEKDGQFHDVDFGENHPTTISDKELGILSRWIDIGAPHGKRSLLDTMAPTLSIMAKIDNNSVTHLIIGSVDVPSGLVNNSLNVCLVENNVCYKSLTSSPFFHQSMEIVLKKPLRNPNIIIRSSISDKSGNITTKDITVKRLINISRPFSPVQN